jgi:glycogen debranching enzyme
MLIAGQSFCLSNDAGDIEEGAAHGWFVADRRILSRCEMFVNGSRIDVLAVHREEPYESLHISRTLPASDRSLLLARRRSLDGTFTEQLEVRNHLARAQRCRVVLKVAADFARLFDVKDGRELADQQVDIDTDASIRFAWAGPQQRRVTIVEATGEVPHTTRLGRMLWDFVLEPQASATLGISVSYSFEQLDDHSKQPKRTMLSSRDQSISWKTRTARIDAAPAHIERVVRRSMMDLGSLRLLDEGAPDPIVVAGAPWFMTLFGRDSLLTSYMAVMFDHSIGRGSVNALARLQGDSFDDASDEQPGRILHELRFADAQSFSLADGEPYFGSVDATPLFVMLIGELMRWGALDTRELTRLLPAVDRALDWITTSGDLDGDGFVEYLVRSPHGLVNQGWKDSFDGVRYGDGRVAEAPIALAEVQAYVFGAYLARADIASALARPDEATLWRDRAGSLAERFDDAFWMDSAHGYAIGLDADKRHIDSVTSNMGHCLWAGIARPDRAADVAAILMSKEMFTGWGIRTLSSANPGYDPLSYHCGSVWPHDTAIAAAGLMRYGCVEEALRLAGAIFEVADLFDARLPELMSGISRDQVPVPVRYPTSCSPQAWAAAAPLYMLKMIAGIEPDMPRRTVAVVPHLPTWLPRLDMHNVPVGESCLSLHIAGSSVHLEGLPDDISLNPV